jgi:predicted CopG family antitoxin
MATKTISLTLPAYDRLRQARRIPDESFSQVVMRASWPDQTVTARELLALWADRPPLHTDSELERIEQAKAADAPPGDKWKRP